MSFIQLAGIDDVKEKEALPEARYDLRITNANVRHNDETGKDNILVIIEADGHPEAKNIMHNIALPNEEDDPEKRETKLLMAKRFFHLFGIPIEDSGISTEAMVGSMAENVKVTQEEYKGQINNRIDVPQMPKE